MLALNHIFLHNWHRFDHCVIEVKDSLYLAGHNGSGKSSLLDAIQLVLVANLKRIRFNSSAQDASDRDIDTYVRGKLGEDRWLRQGRTVAYVALEFANTEAAGANATRAAARSAVVTLGVCIEAEPGHRADRTYFILPEMLDADLFASAGRPLTRQQLRKLLRERSGARSYDSVEEYQTDMLERLGGLNERFFDLFLRALYFRPINNIDGFVEQWLLEKKELSLDTLRGVRERLRDLRAEAERTAQRIERLGAIVAQQQEVKRLGQLRDQYSLLTALLWEEITRRDAARAGQDIAAHELRLRDTQAALDQTEAVLRGAEAALSDARRRLYESDVAQRRDALLRLIDESNRSADIIAARWRALRADLQAESRQLGQLLSVLAPELIEPQALRAFIDEVGALPAAPTPPPRLLAVVEAAAAYLDDAHRRAIEQAAVLRSRYDQLRERGQQLQDEIAALQAQGAIRYDPDVERMQERLQRVLGERPKLLCELLEVTDPRWQDAVEAMLGPRRFNIVVPPQQFDPAALELDRARAQGQVYGVGLIDLENVSRALRVHERELPPDSLARYVTAQPAAVADYVNIVLGDIAACETVAELRQHRRAVTPEVVVYGEFTMRATRPDRYRPHFIGARARQSQIDARQREWQGLQGELAELADELRNSQALERLLNRTQQLSRLAERLNADLDDRPLRAQVEEAHAALRALDLSGLAALEQEIARLDAAVQRERGEQGRLRELRGMLTAKLQDARQHLLACERAALERARAAAAARAQYDAALNSAATALLAERLERADLSDEAGKAESGARRFETQRANEAQRLVELGAQYNTADQFAANPGDPDEPRYAQERERLLATDLPTYKSNIERAEREAEDELREHVLHTLRELITTARSKLEQINDALSELPPFGNEKYRFTCTRADETQEFHDLIMTDSQLLGAGSLFESQFYADNKAAFDRFYDALTRRPLSHAEEEEQERLTDYRHYLSYDIEVTNALTGQKSRLSRIMNQTSGGETQTPFYLTIAASFVQLYRIQERSKRPTIRLVAFDEAFSKMDQSRIGATLDLFQHFKLQIITATPLERCEYLAPKICTSLVLTVVKDHVHIEPYHNYAARLSRLTAQLDGALAEDAVEGPP